MSDEIYKLMKKNFSNIKKFSYPIEMIYDLEEDSEASGRIYSEEGGHVRNTDEFSHTAEEYIQYAANISESIFVFLLDLGEDKSGYVRKFAEYFSNIETLDKDNFKNNYADIDSDTGLPELGRAKRYTFLNRFQKLKNIVESKISEKGKRLEDCIVIFLNKGSLLGSDTRNPAYFIHDIYHAYEFSLGLENPEKINILKEIFKYYSEYYFNANNQSLSSLFGENFDYNSDVLFRESGISSQILNFETKNISDWQNHLFAYSLINISGNIIPRYKLNIKKGLGSEEFTFMPSSEISSPEEFVEKIEEDIYKMCQDVVSDMKGSVIFNFI